ncbi:hypothetical protein E1265_08470 [Streptomyces sp. 8K308]|uniref:IPT/TIG domain-containing protein n=1 Tax=Streptomyces sp. 8K308 TaxID=2530388 RepID=UPI001050EAA0|nr:IPT/TIG domain-containing protein [Streptomyces sp. 8K308]TDC24913.1 hypothetical protein E1265_08470 [Streptomyces sp. 8K308]
MPLSLKGSIGGGTAVTITGTNLCHATKATFGTKSATSTGNAPTLVAVLSLSGAGVADVRVTPRRRQ